MYDLLITNANVLTLDPDVRSATAILVRDGRIAAVGDLSPDDIDPTIPRLDLAGRTVVLVSSTAMCISPGPACAPSPSIWVMLRPLSKRLIWSPNVCAPRPLAI